MSASRTPPSDVLTLLAADHASIEQLFVSLGGASGDDSRAALAAQVCQALSLHASCEEELLYPAAATALSDDRVVRRAEVEHATVKELVRRLETLAPADARFDATRQVLEEYVRHHVDQEERELFPRLRRANLDLRDLGERLARRYAELALRLGEAPRPGAAAPFAPALRAGLVATPDVDPLRVRP